MQITKTLLFSLVAGVAVAAPPQEIARDLQKRTCWELTGTALDICQKACAVACEAASMGLFGTACASACSASNLKRDNEIAARADTDIATTGSTTTTTTDVTTPLIHTVQVTDIDAVTFPTADKSAGRTACIVACEVTCNSTVLALIQTKCLEKCKSLCPSE